MNSLLCLFKSKNLTGDSDETIDFTAFPDFTKFNQTADYYNVITNAKEIHKNIEIRHIDLQKCICYNCRRQKRLQVHGTKKSEALSTANTGGFFLFDYSRQETTRLVLSYLPPSSHLQT